MEALNGGSWAYVIRSRGFNAKFRIVKTKAHEFLSHTYIGWAFHPVVGAVESR